MDPTVSLLGDLVAIPSVNPMGRPGTGTGEAEIARVVADVLLGAGIDAELDEVSPGRPNVIGFLDARAERTLLLEAHLDTVHADQMEIAPFAPDIRDGKLYGRGSCDTKGSLAAFLSVLSALATSGAKPRLNIVLAAVVDEEYQFTGAQHAVRKGLRADFGIAGEPTQLRIVRAHKGVTRWRITTRGKAAHSAYPERGENAIYAMGEVLRRLETHAKAMRTRAPHPVLGTPTLSVGLIEGGQAVNIVPDRCRIEIDRRTLPGESTSAVLEAVREALSELSSWTIEEPHLAVEGMEVPEDAEIIRLLSAAIRASGRMLSVEGAQYATDAGIYNGAAIPTVVFGPGDIAQAHTASEFIDLDEYAAAIEIIRRMVQ
jgi:acetylornithine deacetylase/succinyl-diaminopimelate desuccinylase family protein